MPVQWILAGVPVEAAPTEGTALPALVGCLGWLVVWWLGRGVLGLIVVPTHVHPNDCNEGQERAHKAP